MIFGRRSGATGEMVLLGLSKSELEKIIAGEPLSVGPVPGDTVMSNLAVILVCGENGQEITEHLAKAGLMPATTS